MWFTCSGYVYRKAAERRHAGRTSSDANAAKRVPWAREARKDRRLATLALVEEATLDEPLLVLGGNRDVRR